MIESWNWVGVAGFALVILILVVVMLEAYWRWSNRWFYCRRCGMVWNEVTKERKTFAPDECEGVCRERQCPYCDNRQ